MMDAAEMKNYVYGGKPFQERQMGTGELARAPKASCLKQLFPIIRRLGGELYRCALAHPATKSATWD